MNSYDKKQEILKNIRAELEVSTPIPYPELEESSIDLFEELASEQIIPHFRKTFESLGGHFIELDNYQNLPAVVKKLALDKNWHEVVCASKDIFHFLVEEQLDFIREPNPNPIFATAPACITTCELAIARTGSFIFSSAQNRGRTASILYPNHLVIVNKNQLVVDLKDAINKMEDHFKQDFPSMLNITTGPSRTADIEKTLVTGIHGPQAIYCLFIHK